MKKSIFLLIVVGLLLGWCGYQFASRAWFMLGPNDRSGMSIVIGESWNAERVGHELQQQGIIDSAIGYRVYALLYPAANIPKTGTYTISSVPLNYKALARLFARGPTREEVELTVIEGWTIHDIQKMLTDQGIDVRPSDFLAHRFADDFSFLKGLPLNATVEGYLFPDTYRVWKDQLPDALLRKQLDRFTQQTVEIRAGASQQGKNLHELVTLASIVEKEVRHDADRPVVAGIFLNRLKDGMRLQSDATLNYILQSGHDRLSTSELETDSLYNSYRYAGLPPGPISNPGKAALEAAFTPTKSNYRYFLTDSSGKTYFARTLEEHVKNRYQAFGE